MNNWVYFILETGEAYSRTTQQIADHCFRDVLFSISHRHIVSRDKKDRKDAQGHEAKVNWIFFPAKAEFKQMIKDRWHLCWLGHFHIFKKTPK